MVYRFWEKKYLVVYRFCVQNIYSNLHIIGLFVRYSECKVCTIVKYAVHVLCTYTKLNFHVFFSKILKSYIVSLPFLWKKIFSGIPHFSFWSTVSGKKNIYWYTTFFVLVTTNIYVGLPHFSKVHWHFVSRDVIWPVVRTFCGSFICRSASIF